MNSNPSQEEKILCRLIADLGNLVSLPDLMQASGSANVHSRIAALRRRGCQIPPATVVRGNDGRSKHSFYRLVPGGAA
jgi:hypothetical protein